MNLDPSALLVAFNAGICLMAILVSSKHAKPSKYSLIGGIVGLTASALYFITKMMS